MKALKVEAECESCLLARAQVATYQATTNPALRFRCLAEVVKLLNREFKSNSVAADLGTKRDRIIKQLTKNDDPYIRSKKIANEKALKMWYTWKKYDLRESARISSYSLAFLFALPISS